MMNYNPGKIEAKWQKEWERQGLYRAKDFAKAQKLFLLVEFPYPSGAGLHVGHCRSYTALDVIARKRRMQGYNVLYPIGWDAFGLPSENYAIKTGIHPAITTKQSIATFKKQIKAMGLSFDWNREINTADPNYYKWTQWIFLKLFEQGLAYKAKIPINWCLKCKIGLANEEVIDGKCERCGGDTEKRDKEQWLIRITKYADRLIDDLKLVDFPERVRSQQINWIGKSEGHEIDFAVKNSKDKVRVFTTRIDTIFGCTYLVLAPEHQIISNLKLQIVNIGEVENYIKKTKKKSDIERQAETKDKTGVKLEGVMAINPATGKEIPIFIADYVLTDYGTGAIMAVPAHDSRDFNFAQKHNLPTIEVVQGAELLARQGARLLPYEDGGVLVNSNQFDGLSSEDAKKTIGRWLQESGFARERISYKLRDWVFSRQRYWGEPIPLVYCEKCGWQAVKEKDLPVKLPNVKNYQPTDMGESPLAKIEKWVNTKCPKCGGKARRETDVMPNWAGSNWYFMRYCDPKNSKTFAGKEKLKYFMPVDWYNGGMEHTTLHLLYSRFIYKFLWDIGTAPKELGPEPYKKRTSHGMILAGGGVKMSKSKGNVINPDDVIRQYGADTLRLYEMFMGPFEQAISWDTNSIKGARRFLERVYKLKPQTTNTKINKLLHKTIKKVSEDIEAMKFNTAISCLMEFLNEAEKQGISKESFKTFVILLSPLAPFLAEEMWRELGGKKSVFLEKWPGYEAKLILDDKNNIIVQVNGRVRASVEMAPGAGEEKVKELALQNVAIKKWLQDKEIKKIVFVKDKLINFVI